MTEAERERDLMRRYDRGDPTVGKTQCPRCGGRGVLMENGVPPTPFDEDFHPALYHCSCDDGEIYVEKPATSRL